MAKQGANKQQIHIQMDKKATADLLEIWQKNDREAWTEDAFAVIQAILLQRVSNLPERGARPFEDTIEGEQDETTPNAKELLRIATWADWLAWPVLGVAVVLFAIRFVMEVGQLLQSPFLQAQLFGFSTLFGLVSSFYSLLGGAFYFVILKAVSKGVNFLIDNNEQ